MPRAARPLGFPSPVRNLGGSVGISLITTLLARLSRKHPAMLVLHAAAGNPPYDHPGANS